jgi:carboxymethylenebutenolidase
VIDRELTIPTSHGSMQAFVTHPEEGGPHPVVFFYMDAPGKREELHDMARRLGTAGYYVVLPNLYYRSVPAYNVFSGDPDHRPELMWELMASLTDDLVVADTRSMVDHVDNDPAADATRVGCVGYCMGGPFAFPPRTGPCRGVGARGAPVRTGFTGRPGPAGPGRAVLRLR